MMSPHATAWGTFIVTFTEMLHLEAQDMLLVRWLIPADRNAPPFNAKLLQDWFWNIHVSAYPCVAVHATKDQQEAEEDIKLG